MTVSLLSGFSLLCGEKEKVDFELFIRCVAVACSFFSSLRLDKEKAWKEPCRHKRSTKKVEHERFKTWRIGKSSLSLPFIVLQCKIYCLLSIPSLFRFLSSLLPDSCGHFCPFSDSERERVCIFNETRREFLEMCVQHDKSRCLCLCVGH